MGDNITLEEFRERMSGILSGNSTLDEIISLINTNVMLPPENREYLPPDLTRPPPRTDQNPRPQVRPTPMRRIIRLG